MSDLLPTSDSDHADHADQAEHASYLASGVPVDRAPGDRRAALAIDPAPTDRRQKTRRLFDLKRIQQVRTMSLLGTMCGLAAVVTAAWSLAYAPETHTKTPCSDVFSDAFVHHRSMHPAWFAAVLLSVLTVALPERSRRTFISVGCFGLVLGLAVAAIIRVGTWKTGICFA